MSDMPDRIKAWLWNGKADAGGWHVSGQGTVEAYIRHDAPELVALVETLQNVMGHIDTPIARRRLGISDSQPEWLTRARAALAAWEQKATKP